MSIGNRIKIRREELGMTQDELAQRLGYKSRSSVNKIELNQRNLPQAQIKAIANILDTTPSYIMGWDEEENIEQIQTELEIVEMISKHYGNQVIQILNDLLQFDSSEQEKLSSFIAKYKDLDLCDRAELRGYMFSKIEDMMKSEKYSVKKGLKNA